MGKCYEGFSPSHSDGIRVLLVEEGCAMVFSVFSNKDEERSYDSTSWLGHGISPKVDAWF